MLRRSRYSHYPIASMERFLAGVTPLSDLDGPNVWDTASIMYTSGTTGPSKGVVMPWGQLYEIATRPYPTTLLTKPTATTYLP